MLELDILPIPVFLQSDDVPIALLISDAPAVCKHRPAIVFELELINITDRR